ncbi:MAG: hypothetical protein QXI19_08365, partial [Candidatus Caldarchaeum sp.]
LLFPLRGRSDPQTGRALVSPFPEPREGALLFEGQIFLPTLGTSPNSIIEILQSRSAAEEILSRHGTKLFGRVPDGRDFERFADALSLEVTETGYLRASFRWSDPELGQAVLSDLVAYASMRAEELARDFAEDSLIFLEKEVSEAEKEVARHAERLRKVLERAPLVMPNSERESFVAHVLNVNARWLELMVDLRGTEAALDTTLHALRESAREGVQGEAFTQIASQFQNQVAQYRMQLSLASRVLAGDSPELKRLREQLDSAGRSYVEELERVVKHAQRGSLGFTLSLESRRADLRARLRATEQALRDLRQQSLEHARVGLDQMVLSRELERAESRLDMVVREYYQAKIAQTKQYKPFVVVDAPYASRVPVFPRRGIFALCGLGVGVMVGLFLFLRRLSEQLPEDRSA